MRVEVEIEEQQLQGSRGPVMGVVATCQECEHQVECFGTSERSVKRACMMLREECPMEQENFYVPKGE